MIGSSISLPTASTAWENLSQLTRVTFRIFARFGVHRRREFSISHIIAALNIRG